MTLDIATIAERIFWSGAASVGFGILFNIPRRIIIQIFILGAIAGAIKFSLIFSNIGIIPASLAAASFVGFGSIPIARNKKTIPFLLSIPAVIPMIPGYFGYKMLLGLTKFALSQSSEEGIQIILYITKNGLNMVFVLIALSVGVSLPWLIFRKKILKKIKLEMKDDLI